MTTVFDAHCELSARITPASLLGSDPVKESEIAVSTPRLRSMAMAPATTLRTPSANIAVALVPSPTASPVFTAPRRSICAPKFSSATIGNGRVVEGGKWMEFVGRRVEDFDLLWRLAACRSPQEISKLYWTFWQNAVDDYWNEFTFMSRPALVS